MAKKITREELRGLIREALAAEGAPGTEGGWTRHEWRNGSYTKHVWTHTFPNGDVGELSAIIAPIKNNAGYSLSMNESTNGDTPVLRHSSAAPTEDAAKQRAETVAMSRGYYDK